MRFSFVLLFVLLLFLPQAFAGEIVTAKNAVSGDALVLQDGRTLRLAGIKEALPNARAFLDNAAFGRELVLHDVAADRYGRVAATATVMGEAQSLQDVLLREGLAFVYPVLDDARLGAWLETERGAREAKRGFWAEDRDVSSQRAAVLLGKYGFVAGVVSKAERVKNKAYLYFGNPLRPDFTIVVAAKFLRPLKRLGIDALALEGKRVRVRGWVSDNAGPTITITNVYQIEGAE